MSGARLVGRWMAASWRGQEAWLAWILGASLLNAVVLTAFPWLWQYLVDAMQTGDPGGIGRIGLWLLLVGAGQSALYILLQGSRTIMNSRIQRRTRQRVFDHLTTLPDAAFTRWRPGDLVTRLTDDAGDKTAWFLCSGVFRAYEAALIVLVCVAAMLWIDPWLTLWVVTPLPLLVVVQALLQGVLARRYAEVQEAISGINDQLATTFGGIRIVQASGLAGAMRARFLEQAERQRAAEVRVARVNQAIFLMYGYGWQLAVGLLLLVGGPRVLSEHITLGQLIAFEGFLMTLVWPMFDVGMFVSKYMQAGVALSRLQAVLDEPGAEPPADGRPPGDGALEARDARVTAGDAVLLREVDVALRPGELVAVVGEVGSGKSTLVRLFAGAAPLAAGALAVGGVPVEEADRAALREAVAYVPQDAVLLTATVRDNILLGRDLSEEALAVALRVSRLEQDLPALPKGLDTLVGERGVTLSGGQQQRVALARALVGRPRVLLLDDATAALDADTEAAFWAELEGVLGGVTAVVVTHRPGTIERADRVLVLERGRIVQRGRHAELIGGDGPYRRIYGRFSALESLSTA